jgi:hypothetical protein
MKLLRRDRKQLESVLENLERVQRFILSDRFCYVMPKSMATTTTDLSDSQGRAFTCPLEKNVGTELCYLYTATGRLKRLLGDPA